MVGLQSIPSVRMGTLPAWRANALRSCKGYLTRRGQFSGCCPCWIIRSALAVTLGKSDLEGKTETTNTQDKTTRTEAPRPTNSATATCRQKGAETWQATRSEESQPLLQILTFIPGDDLRHRGTSPSVKAFVALRHKGSQSVAPQGLATRQHTHFSRKTQTVLGGKGRDVPHKPHPRMMSASVAMSSPT